MQLPTGVTRTPSAPLAARLRRHQTFATIKMLLTTQRLLETCQLVMWYQIFWISLNHLNSILHSTRLPSIHNQYHRMLCKAPQCSQIHTPVCPHNSNMGHLRHSNIKEGNIQFNSNNSMRHNLSTCNSSNIRDKDSPSLMAGTNSNKCCS